MVKVLGCNHGDTMSLDSGFPFLQKCVSESFFFKNMGEPSLPSIRLGFLEVSCGLVIHAFPIGGAEGSLGQSLQLSEPPFLCLYQTLRRFCAHEMDGAYGKHSATGLARTVSPEPSALSVTTHWALAHPVLQ